MLFSSYLCLCVYSNHIRVCSGYLFFLVTEPSIHTCTHTLNQSHTHTHTPTHTHTHTHTHTPLTGKDFGYNFVPGEPGSLATEGQTTAVEKLKQAEELIAELNMTWEDKLKKTEAIQKER